jgi:hypothetical protein
LTSSLIRYCEESLIESVSTLIWVAPRLLADIQELSVVEKQLENKFGKEFALQARSNMTRTVNQKVSVPSEYYNNCCAQLNLHIANLIVSFVNGSTFLTGTMHSYTLLHHLY